MNAVTTFGNASSVVAPSVMPLSFSGSMTATTNALRTIPCTSLMDSLVRQANVSDGHENRESTLQTLAQKALLTGHSQFCNKNPKTCDASAFETLCDKAPLQKYARREFFIQLLMNRQFPEAHKIALQLSSNLEKNAAFYLLAIRLRAAGLFDEADRIEDQINATQEVKTRILIEPNSQTVQLFNQVIASTQIATIKDFDQAIKACLQIQEPIFQDMATIVLGNALYEEIIKPQGNSGKKTIMIQSLDQIPDGMLNNLIAYWKHLKPTLNINIKPKHLN